MKRFTSMLIAVAFVLGAVTTAAAKPPKGDKSKFYDFSDQLIDGEIRKPISSSGSSSLGSTNV